MPLDVSTRAATGSDVSASAGSNPSQAAPTSYEQIFSPVEIRAGFDGSLGFGFQAPIAGYSAGGGAFDQGHAGATRAELDPYFSTVLDGSTSTFIQECDYQMMMNNSEGQEGGDANIRKVDRANINAVQVSQFRVPMVMSGWGFDLGDRPVPSFGENALQFDTALVNDRTTWLSGPLDVKWDCERKVWAGGHQLLHGVAAEAITAPVDPCEPTYFDMKVFRNNTPCSQFDDEESVDIDNCELEETITVTNRDSSLAQAYVIGRVYVVAARINYEWVPIWVGCPEYEEGLTSPDCVC